MEPILVVFPVAGLVNRLRTMASAYILAQSVGRKFYVNWAPEPVCNAAWHDLFTNVFPGFRADIQFFQNNDCLYHRNQFTNYETDLPRALQADTRPLLAVEGLHQFIPVGMDSLTFNNLKSGFYKSLTPSPPVGDKLRQAAELFNIAQLIGIHIRRTDLVTDLGWNPYHVSPIEDFIAQCYQELAQKKFAGFFLSTDSKSDEHRLRQERNLKIFTQPERTLERDDKKGIQDALVDWLLLSQTKFIIRSYYSSFSEEACIVNHVESQVIVRRRSRVETFLSDLAYAPKHKIYELIYPTVKKLKIQF